MTVMAGPGMNAGLRNPDSFIACHLRFDDAGPRELHGMPVTIAGGASISSTNCKFHGTALQIASGDYCTVAHSNALDFLYRVSTAQKWSIAWWTTGLDTSSGQYPWIMGIDESAGSLVIYWASEQQAICTGIANESGTSVCEGWLIGDGAPTTAGMHYCVLTYDQALSSNNMKLYVDGTLIGQQTKTSTTPSTTASSGTFHIGYYADWSAYGEFPMSVDELIIYKDICIDGTVVPTRRR